MYPLLDAVEGQGEAPDSHYPQENKENSVWLDYLIIIFLAQLVPGAVQCAKSPDPDTSQKIPYRAHNKSRHDRLPPLGRLLFQGVQVGRH